MALVPASAQLQRNNVVLGSERRSIDFSFAYALFCKDEGDSRAVGDD